MTVVRLHLPLLLISACAGCARQNTVAETPWSPAAVDDLGSIVAQVGTVPVRAREVEAEMVRSGTTPRQALDNLISLHLLAETARPQQGFSPQWMSDVELKSALAERLIDREVAPKLVRESVPDAELKGIYQKAIKAFVHPRLVDIAVLAVYTGPLMKKEPRLKRAETARALAAYLATRTIRGPEDFEAIAKDPAWQDRKVSFGRFLQGDDEPFSAEMGTAVAKLRAPGDTTRLVEDETGFYWATYAGEKPPENITFAEAKPSLLQRYYERWRKLQLEKLVRQLGEGHRIEAHPQLLQ
jgi:hypothetical protein